MRESSTLPARERDGGEREKSLKFREPKFSIFHYLVLTQLHEQPASIYTEKPKCGLEILEVDGKRKRKARTIACCRR